LAGLRFVFAVRFAGGLRRFMGDYSAA
jgi:hypothetical protein